MAAKVQCVSRFALLKVEDDDSSDDSDIKAKKTSQTSGQKTSNSKKRNKKKKKAEEDREKDELRNLAFGKSGQKNKGPNVNTPSSSSSSNATPSTSSHSNDPIGSSHTDRSQEQWEEWKKLDTEHTLDTYEKELQEAMMQSKLEYQKRIQFLEATKDIPDTSDCSGKDGKKKKKKNFLTLDEFNKLGAGDSENTSQNINGGASNPIQQSKVLNTSNLSAGADDDKKFFNRVEEDAGRAIRKELIHEEYRKQYVAENARSAQYQKEMDKRDKEIAMLRASLKNMEDELKQVKKRNKQLCVILAQGEMKDKADVLMQLEDLTAVKDELTEQLTDITGELERERSKVHALQKELDKFKGGKHTKN